MTMDPVVRFEAVELAFDEKVILDGVSFVLAPGHLKIVLGASGAGKSTILRLILGLLKPDGGRIFVNGAAVHDLPEHALMAVRANVGMVFQEGALFDSLTVRENVGYRLYEESDMPLAQVDARVQEVLGFVGLGEYGERMPSELSGGQRRRVAIARAIAAQPGVVLYDEPTTGLDPITSISIGDEIVKLRDLARTSSIIVTHQLRDAFHIASYEARDHDGRVEIVPASAEKSAMTTFLMLRDGKVAFDGSLAELLASGDPYLRAFIGTPPTASTAMSISGIGTAR